MNRVLFVGSSSGEFKAIEHVITNRGGVVVREEQGLIALAGLESINPVLTICEYELPDISGLELALSIKKHYFEMPCILLFEWQPSTRLIVSLIKKGIQCYRRPVPMLPLVLYLDKLLEPKASC